MLLPSPPPNLILQYARCRTLGPTRSCLRPARYWPRRFILLFVNYSPARPPADAAASRQPTAPASFSFSLWAGNYWTTSWLISIDPSRYACRNNLNRDVHRRDITLVTHQVYIAAADVGEALACVVDRGRAGGVISLVYRELHKLQR